MLRLLTFCLFLGAVAVAAADDAPDFGKVGRPFLEKHCLACHGGKEPKGELSLDGFTDGMSVVRQRKTWDNVLKLIVSGDMPPKDKPRPAAAEIEEFVAHIQAVIDYADRNSPPNPGRVTMRRLNRVEYRNTVRDLLGVDFDPTEGFPSDDVGHGFDNIGDVLTVSPLLMERYLDAAESIVNRVIVVNPPPPPSRYLSGKYLQPNNAQTSQDRFRVLDPKSEEAVHSGPFTAGGDYLKFSADADLMLRANLYAETNNDAPVQVALFITGAKLTDVAGEEERSKFLGANAAKLPPLKILKVFEITARDAQNVQQIEFPVNRMGDIQSAGVALLKPPDGKDPAKLFIQHIWSEGPLETRPASHLKILASAPDQSPAARTREVMTRLLKRGYRRPPTDAEIVRMIQLVEAAEAGGEKWEAGMQQAIQVLLCSPKFLFRVELDDRPQSAEPTPLDEFQLASRLSYFLWSTMPDDELFALAEKQELTARLDEQVRRMNVHPKSSAFVKNFALQWLQIQRLEKFAPDAKLFPTFDDRLKAAMLKETELFFASVLKEDRSLFDLLSADYTFLNEQLAKHYGIADTKGNRVGEPATVPDGKPIQGPEFQQVMLQGTNRGGLLTQASVLTVTSNPTRTSPVKRGRWVLEQILGESPPPPPPNVPELPNSEQAVAEGSLRKRMEIHRQDVRCANCHAKMDAIGFALENFDAIGQWRTKDGAFDVDATGEFADGAKFTGPEGLKTVLAQKRDMFARCLAEKMLTYALGRGVEYYDRRAVDRIVSQLGVGGDKISVLITEIVKSDPFRQRRGAVNEEP